MSTGNYAFHHRFTPNTKWVFPDKNYEYYNFMVEMGYGKKDPELLKRYIANKKIVDGKSGFDISYEFDLNIPDYDIVNGEWWRTQFYEYLADIHNDENITYYFPVVNKVILSNAQNGKQVENEKTSSDQEKEENEVIAAQINFYETK